MLVAVIHFAHQHHGQAKSGRMRACTERACMCGWLAAEPQVSAKLKRRAVVVRFVCCLAMIPR